ncbi:GNAT family N-acetyltransferase [Photobacterium profundum]|uniref:Acetyltransferase n=1 Tax=Photobacterium profundum 3TCK TaxID=314280 RepID=Q1YYH4_9GAMM|nr:GNAT family N-acetyltransferase [Photobacterium profundum]EAS41348.1 acetyltransferase [Photobacterium profundum 3TCK]PSV62674.1 GNAT family N-acetyltransferase [Photobacterium profundum]
MIKIRILKKGDELELWQLKVSTIWKVNIKDYSQEQLNVWAPDEYNPEKWLKRVHGMNPNIAEIDGKIVGFADIQDDGYIDHFFCHNEFQGQGVGKMLMQNLINKGKEKSIPRIYSHVSITAKPFFERFGFHVVKQQAMNIGNQALTNYVMEKINK